MNINWSLIKNGFKGFECLAVDYVNDNIDEVDWSKTPETRDGNKDAIAIYYSFGEADRKSEWWMEAKYSKKTKKLTRYRIDSTIVSAISQGNVARVVFVTNLEMDNKSMNDTKNVLLKDKCCKQVDFILKQHIEYWLINNLKKYNEYFPTLTKKKFSELQISNNGAFKTINFYAQDKFSTFSESIDKLYEQEMYKMTFSYISNKNENIEIKLIERNLMFEGNKNKILYPIIKGINDIELNVIVIQANNNNNNCILEIDKTKIISNRNISFIPKTNRELKIYSQINAINSIKTIVVLRKKWQNVAFKVAKMVVCKKDNKKVFSMVLKPLEHTFFGYFNQHFSVVLRLFHLLIIHRLYSSEHYRFYQAFRVLHNHTTPNKFH